MIHTAEGSVKQEECVNTSMRKRKVTDPRSLLPSSSSSMSEGGLVRGGQERVDTFRDRMEACSEKNFKKHSRDLAGMTAE